MKLLKVAIENQRWDVAAHALVIGMVKAKQATAQMTSNAKKKPSKTRAKRC
jgi:hypothetical protein